MPKNSSPGSASPEVPQELRSVSENVRQRLALQKNVRETRRISTSEVQKPPLPHTEMTKMFWQSHDINNPDDRKKLALFTARFDVM